MKCMFPKWNDWNTLYTNSARLKMITITTVKYSSFAAFALVMFQLENSDKEKYTAALMRQALNYISKA